MNYDLKIKTLMRLFPYLENEENAKYLQIDNDSMHYISLKEYAEKITKIIINQLYKMKQDPKKCIITDGTAGVGGNTISFCKSFKKVNAIEIDEIRVQYLQNNLQIYNLKNIVTYNGDCTSVLKNIDDHDIIFLDPIWGKDYKKFKNLKLEIGMYSIEDLCIDLMNPNKMRKIPKIIIYKLPKNYDIVYFYKKINKKSIYYYDLQKMIILVIIV
jgi:16S rRNA G966 N2-methylase RsmD